jgi:dimeric dUTPase (all-alpha-NTP-PPase superfamily)
VNLEKLFQIQAELDQKIVDSKGLEERDLLNEKILALQVELGECANELPEVFKFWSNKKNNYTKALEEYVDGLHFILSIGNEIAPYPEHLDINYEKHDRDVLWHFQSIISFFSDFWQYGELEQGYGAVIKLFLDLGELLGFTQEQIEQAYLDKNEVNHARQVNGY